MKPFKLATPITVIDQTVVAITFREPTGEDLIGLPDMIEDKMGFAVALADRLASNVPPGTVRKLAAADAMGAALAATAALNPTIPPSSSTDISSAPGGGATAPASLS